MPNDDRPLVALTLGDVAGIGPEVVARAWGDTPLRALARPFVVGSRTVLERALDRVGCRAEIQEIQNPEDAQPTAKVIPCLEGTSIDVSSVRMGRVDPRAGKAAYDYLAKAVDLALAGRIDAITTLPLNKEALHAGGVDHPGHTEILAERCGVKDHAMMLYVGPPVGAGDAGLGVVHVTLHVALRRVFDLITEESVKSKIALADQALLPLTGGRKPRVAVAALNPHAGEGGLFGDEETRIIEPAVARARAAGIDVTGPIASDTLFNRAIQGEFDAVVAMYHDQGHVALKTVGFDRAVNVTLGLPIIRTSVAHGTAYDIAGNGTAETSSLIEAVRVAARLVWGNRQLKLNQSTASAT
ncbi:4-hydroxythreonine-4-phosphate dehydrogenase PdxA [Singulisphaera sp. PoT]|uniref:4-hydroxythreonine-4-phosphate dehydrogenase PdxA n=1 Tax=Singulisphaera sp. PoT TaxID=3411797 RepID=UPI003BF56EBA